MKYQKKSNPKDFVSAKIKLVKDAITTIREILSK